MNINKLRIRPVEKSEVYNLQEIGKKTFKETFVNDCSASDMKKHLHNTFNIKALNDELINPNSYLFFVESKRKIIGYLKMFG